MDMVLAKPASTAPESTSPKVRPPLPNDATHSWPGHASQRDLPALDMLGSRLWFYGMELASIQPQKWIPSFIFSAHL